MNQDFGWLKHQGDKPEPRLERIATLWRMRGTSGRDIECAAFRTETGIELRTMYSPEEIIVAIVPRPGRGRQDCRGSGSMAIEPARERVF
jgi:hypothetical protein